MRVVVLSFFCQGVSGRRCQRSRESSDHQVACLSLAGLSSGLKFLPILSVFILKNRRFYCLKWELALGSLTEKLPGSAKVKGQVVLGRFTSLNWLFACEIAPLFLGIFSVLKGFSDLQAISSASHGPTIFSYFPTTEGVLQVSVLP